MRSTSLFPLPLSYNSDHMSTMASLGLSLYPYHFLSSGITAAATTSTRLGIGSSASTALAHSSSYFGDIVLQFSKQILRPKVLLPMLFVVVLLFDLDGEFDFDEEFFLDEDDFTGQLGDASTASRP